MIIRALFIITFCLSGMFFRVLSDDRVRFNQDIRPILSNRCFQCHGPDIKKRKSHLRLDRSDGEEGAYRVHEGSQAINPGNLEDSALWYRINSDDEEEVMPPPNSHKGSVTAAEKTLIRKWILEGARYEDFWAFVPPQAQAVPEPTNAGWSSRPIDRFVMAKLESQGLQPSPQAGKRTLIRRASFDLTGLPPTLEEIEEFLKDNSDDAYENLVERLLAKPQYGEHMAKYWLDLVRFADTNGLHHDHYRDMTPYRDWVIRSFNANLKFDDFISYQVAGDLFPEASVDQLVASGFNRLHLIIDRGTALPEESFTRNVVDRVTAVGTAFMGLTVQCAVCHDHKYDPVTQKDFYQLFAFFNNFDGGPETGGRGGSDFKRGLQPPYINVPTPEQKAKLASFDAEEKKFAALIEEHQEALKNSKTGEEKENHQNKIEDYGSQLERLKKERPKLEESLPAALVMKERSEVRPAHILIRGVYDQKGEEVERGTPAFLPPLEKQDGLKTRLDLAKWLTADSNPLTARVTVNRFWQQFFGVGIVKTSEDFGAQGEWPSHPALLDDLTIRFVKSGWNVKQLVRAILLSKTYQQSSRASRDQFVNDPENRLLARGSRFRLDAEMIRDQVLAVSGLLNSRMYGKSVKPPQPAGLWKSVAMPSSYPREFRADSGDQIYRRSVYSFWKRALPPPQMTIFDAPMRESCIARRERTNTPLQALMLMNETQFFDAAEHCAQSLLSEPGLDEDQRISRAYEELTSQLPGESAMKKMKTALSEFRNLYAGDLESAKAMTGTLSQEDPKRRVELAAWTMLVHSLLNLDITKTRQ